MKFKNIKERPKIFVTKFTGILEISDGSKSLPYINHREHYKSGILHRTNGPAVEYCALHNPRSGYPGGARKWYIEGKLHNKKGAACLWESGSKEWYLFGFKYNKGEWLEELKLMKKYTDRKAQNMKRSTKKFGF